MLQAPVAEGESRLGLHLAAERAHAHARKRSPVLHRPLGLLKGGELHGDRLKARASREWRKVRRQAPCEPHLLDRREREKAP